MANASSATKVEEGTILNCIKMNRCPAPELSDSEKSSNDVSDGELNRLLYGGDEPDIEEVRQSDKNRRACHEDTVKIKVIIKNNAMIPSP